MTRTLRDGDQFDRALIGAIIVLEVLTLLLVVGLAAREKCTQHTRAIDRFDTVEPHVE